MLDISYLRYQGRSLLDLKSQVSGTLPPTKLGLMPFLPDLSSPFFFFSFFYVHCRHCLSVCGYCSLFCSASKGPRSGQPHLNRIFVRGTCLIGAFSSSPPANPTPVTSPTPSSNRISIVPVIPSPFSRSLHASPRIAPVPPEFTMATGMTWACTPSRPY